MTDVIQFMFPNDNLINGLHYRLVDKGDGAGIEIEYWNSSNVKKPTKTQLKNAIKQFELEKERTKYRELRAAAYPPITEQLDALWKGGAEAEAMKQKILEVKNRYPKAV